MDEFFHWSTTTIIWFISNGEKKRTEPKLTKCNRRETTLTCKALLGWQHKKREHRKLINRWNWYIRIVSKLERSENPRPKNLIQPPSHCHIKCWQVYWFQYFVAPMHLHFLQISGKFILLDFDSNKHISSTQFSTSKQQIGTIKFQWFLGNINHWKMTHTKESTSL